MKRGSGWVLLAPLAVLVLFASASYGGSRNAAQTFSVNVDGHNPKANEVFLAYYPHVVSVHPGDTVVFHEVGPGEPHTVTLGTLTDSVVSQYEKLTPKQRQGPPPKALLRLDAKLPFLLPQGPGDAIQSAANPCFLSTGVPSSKSACPKTTQPDFTGSQAYYNSGWLNSNARFTVRVSKTTPTGTYYVMCLLHREGMTGKIDVVPSTTSVPSPSEQAATGARQLAAVEAKLAPAAAALRKGKPPIPVVVPGKSVVLAGSGSPNAQEAEVAEFGPKTIKIPVGGSVIWYLLGDHSITFNSNKTNNDVRKTAADGTVHLNSQALVPVGGPGEPHSSSGGGPPNGSSTAPPKFRVVASTSWNGSGFLSSGVFVNSFGPPLIEGYKLTFTKAGTYKYICTVHDHMKGTVVVG
jgi:plastocyanin